MAVVQISKIQVRRGLENQTGIPYLSSGEFAWAIDTQNLYIGPGAVSEGSPSAYPPVRVLTERDFNNVFKLAGTYTYQGNSPSVETLFAGTGTNYATQRTLQDKLDDYVSLADFGAVGNGIADDTKALQSAIDQLYLNVDKSSPQSRRRLKFPAGTYSITGTIYIPPYANIEGEGSSSTFIVQTANDGSPVFRTVGGTSTPAHKVEIPNIQATSQPTNITIKGMSVRYKDHATEGGSATGLISVDCALNATLDDVGFLGMGANPSDTQGLIGLYVRGQQTVTTRDLTVKNCKFQNLYSGIASDYDSLYYDIRDSMFTNLVIGISLDSVTGNPGQQVGPSNVRVSGNKFDLIKHQAIYANNECHLVTSQNYFLNCGNDNSNDVDNNQQTEVIYSKFSGNQFIDDEFAREVANLLTNPGKLLTAISGTSFIQNHNPISVSLAVSNIPATILTVAKPATDTQVVINYNASQPTLGVTRIGQLQVLAGANTATVIDSFQWAGATTLVGDIQFGTILNTSTNALSVTVTNPVGSVPTNLTLQFNRLY